MPRAVPDPSLDEILSSVSRSFYLSLTVLPRSVRTQISSAYLLARAADTIADTHAVRAERRGELLAALRLALTDPARADRLARDLRDEVIGTSHGDPSIDAEHRLLARFAECVALIDRQSRDDRARSHRLLEKLVEGMERDLARFPDEGTLRAIGSVEELEQHAYLAAGCVGEFWSEMLAAHVPGVPHLASPELVARAVHLGKALQLINILRDVPADLRAGRCYLPAPMLARHGLTPADLVGPDRRRARPALDELRLLAVEHADAAFPYVLAIPPSAPRLRLACVWPLWIGLDTLALLARAADPLDPSVRLKIPRRRLYGLIAESVAVVGVNPLLQRRHWHHRAMAARRKLLGRDASP